MSTRLINTTVWSLAQESTLTLVSTLGGMLSFLPSAVVIVMIYRSTVKLSKPSRRIIFGMTAYDLVSSISAMASSFPSPKGTRPFAFGSQETCSAQGFLGQLGGLGSILYNTSLAVHYLCVIKFEMKEETFNKRVEPILHIISNVCAWSSAIFLVSSKSFSFEPDNFNCWTTSYETHGCSKSNDNSQQVDCMEQGENYFKAIFMGIPLIVCFIINVIAMSLVISTMVDQAIQNDKNRNAWRTTTASTKPQVTFMSLLFEILFSRFYSSSSPSSLAPSSSEDVPESAPPSKRKTSRTACRQDDLTRTKSEEEEDCSNDTNPNPNTEQEGVKIVTGSCTFPIRNSLLANFGRSPSLAPSSPLFHSSAATTGQSLFPEDPEESTPKISDPRSSSCCNSTTSIPTRTAIRRNSTILTFLLLGRQQSKVEQHEEDNTQPHGHHRRFNQTNEKKAMSQSLYFILAFLGTHLFFFIYFLHIKYTESMTADTTIHSLMFWIALLARITNPLQGLFNILVYTRPYVLSTMKRTKCSWWKAFWITLKNGGDNDDVADTIISRRRRRSTRRAERRRSSYHNIGDDLCLTSSQDETTMAGGGGKKKQNKTQQQYSQQEGDEEEQTNAIGITASKGIED